ncbi:uncharacterized protein LOC131434390 [Malaya genurostris]|uniref:uncharacterized protein LOC131434390 n=1 Tax=Malaya genurostris TaxID=325434 RepID=UPI0026F38686|nr:uncharacterized protein LOC131434390 [Malaya genurostris]
MLYTKDVDNLHDHCEKKNAFTWLMNCTTDFNSGTLGGGNSGLLKRFSCRRSIRLRKIENWTSWNDETENPTNTTSAQSPSPITTANTCNADTAPPLLQNATASTLALSAICTNNVSIPPPICSTNHHNITTTHPPSTVTSINTCFQPPTFPTGYHNRTVPHPPPTATTATVISTNAHASCTPVLSNGLSTTNFTLPATVPPTATDLAVSVSHSTSSNSPHTLNIPQSESRTTNILQPLPKRINKNSQEAPLLVAPPAQQVQDSSNWCDSSLIECLKLVRQSIDRPLSFISFKLRVPSDFENLITSPDFWPSGVSIAPFLEQAPLRRPNASRPPPRQQNVYNYTQVQSPRSFPIISQSIRRPYPRSPVQYPPMPYQYPTRQSQTLV